MDKIEDTFDAKLRFFVDSTSKPINIHYTIEKPGQASLKILDKNGREIITLADSYHPPGEYNAKLDEQKFSNGTYICKLQTLDVTLFCKLIISRKK